MVIPEGAVSEGQSVEIFLGVLRDDEDRPKLQGKRFWCACLLLDSNCLLIFFNSLLVYSNCLLVYFYCSLVYYSCLLPFLFTLFTVYSLILIV